MDHSFSTHADSFSTQSPFAEPDIAAACDDPAPKRGRPSDYSPRTLGMLRGIIRELGLSDSAAAERIGLHKSTISRWKREHPEVRPFLRQAREECRALHLMKIIESSQAQNGKGWRASAWLLERLFPEDYAPSATQRERFRDIAERRQEKEEQEFAEAELAESVPEATTAGWAAHGQEEEAYEPQETPPVHPVPYPPSPAAPSEAELQNYRNANGPAKNTAPLPDAPSTFHTPLPMENHSELELQNSRNDAHARAT